MFIIKRNQILIVILVIMVAIAGYLNYSDKKSEENKMLDSNLDSLLMPSSVVEENENKVDDAKEDNNIGSATLISEEDNNFFLEAKINREQTRSERKEWLMDLINTVATTDDAKENAMSEIINIQEVIEKEMQAESLIESKGFGSTYVRVDDDSVDVIVGKQNLTQNEIAQIADIVKRKTGFTIDKIKISSLKEQEH